MIDGSSRLKTPVAKGELSADLENADNDEAKGEGEEDGLGKLA
jgi:hypothetical protein